MIRAYIRYSWQRAREDFERGVYPARIAQWLGTTESDVWNLATTEGWKRPADPPRMPPTCKDGGFAVPFELQEAVWKKLFENGFTFELSLDEPFTWRDLPPVAYLTPIGFAALSLLSQVIGR